MDNTNNNSSLRSSEESNDVWGAIIRCKSKVSPVEKNTKNPFYKSTYADYSAIWEALFPILQEESLDVSSWPTSRIVEFPNKTITLPNGNKEEEPVLYLNTTLTTRITHVESFQWVEFDTVIPTPRIEPQGFGMTVTYGRRYAIMPFFGIVTEDDDGNSSINRKPPQPTKITEGQITRIKQLVEEYGETDEKALCNAVGGKKVNSYVQLSYNDAQKTISGLLKRIDEKKNDPELKTEE